MPPTPVSFACAATLPGGWLQGRSHPADGNGLSGLDLSHGIGL